MDSNNNSLVSKAQEKIVEIKKDISDEIKKDTELAKQKINEGASKVSRYAFIVEEYFMFIIIFFVIILIIFMYLMYTISYNLNNICYDMNKIREQLTGDGSYCHSTEVTESH